VVLQCAFRVVLMSAFGERRHSNKRMPGTQGRPSKAAKVWG